MARASKADIGISSTPCLNLLEACLKITPSSIRDWIIPHCFQITVFLYFSIFSIVSTSTMESSSAVPLAFSYQSPLICAASYSPKYDEADRRCWNYGQPGSQTCFIIARSVYRVRLRAPRSQMSTSKNQVGESEESPVIPPKPPARNGPTKASRWSKASLTTSTHSVRPSREPTLSSG